MEGFTPQQIENVAIRSPRFRNSDVPSGFTPLASQKYTGLSEEMLGWQAYMTGNKRGDPRMKFLQEKAADLIAGEGVNLDDIAGIGLDTEETHPGVSKWNVVIYQSDQMRLPLKDY